VLDFASYIAGSYGPMILDPIRRPSCDDHARSWGINRDVDDAEGTQTRRANGLGTWRPHDAAGRHEDSRGVDLASVDGIDEQQVASWMRQAAALPGFGATKR